MEKMMTLISKWKWGSEHQDEDVAPNAKSKEDVALIANDDNAALNAKMKMNNGSERQTENE